MRPRLKRQVVSQGNPELMMSNEISMKCVPPYPLIGHFAFAYQKKNIAEQLEFMSNIERIIFSACKDSPHLNPLNTWKKLDDFLKTQLMRAYSQHRAPQEKNPIIETVKHGGTNFDLLDCRVMTNLITMVNLHSIKDTKITTQEFIFRCEKYFNFIFPENIKSRGTGLIASSETNQQNKKIKRHVMAKMPEEDLEILCDFLLKMIYNNDETREKRIDAIFALIFLYGSKPHVVFFVHGNVKTFVGGAFATDFLLQYLLASIGEKPIRKNYLALTEVELLLLFGKDDEAAWLTPRKCYLAAVDDKQSNLFFHQGDTLSLLTMIVTNNRILELAKKYAEGGKEFYRNVLQTLSYLLIFYEQFYFIKFSMPNISQINTFQEFGQEFSRLCDYVKSLKPESKASFDKLYNEVCSALRKQLAFPESIAASLLKKIEMNQPVCREELFLYFKLAKLNELSASDNAVLDQCISLFSPLFALYDEMCVAAAKNVKDFFSIYSDKHFLTKIDKCRLPDGKTLFQRAMDEKQFWVCALLLSNESIDNSQGENRTLLFKVVKMGDVDLARVILRQYDAKVSDVDDLGKTLLFTAVESDHFEMVKLIIRELKHDERRPGFFDNAISSSITRGVVSGHLQLLEKIKDFEKEKEFLELLKSHHLDIGNIENLTALHVAIIYGNAEVACELERIAPPEKFDERCALKVGELKKIFMPQTPFPSPSESLD